MTARETPLLLVPCTSAMNGAAVSGIVLAITIPESTRGVAMATGEIGRGATSGVTKSQSCSEERAGMHGHRERTRRKTK